MNKYRNSLFYFPNFQLKRFLNSFQYGFHFKVMTLPKKQQRSKNGSDIHKLFPLPFLRHCNHVMQHRLILFDVALFSTFFILLCKRLSLAIKIKFVQRYIYNIYKHPRGSFFPLTNFAKSPFSDHITIRCSIATNNDSTAVISFLFVIHGKSSLETINRLLQFDDPRQQE